jgi:hypothetical protein
MKVLESRLSAVAFSRPVVALAAAIMLLSPVLASGVAIHQWSQRFGSTSEDVGSSVAADASGNVFVTGNFSGTVNFGGGNLVSAGSWDIFLAKYDAAGVHQWSKRFGAGGADIGYVVAVDGSGNVFVTGRFAGTVNFGGVNLPSAGGFDIFLAKYDAAGVHQWSKRFGAGGDDAGFSVDVDGSGNPVVTGFFNGTVNFGGANLPSAGLEDIFVAKYDASGAHLWSQSFGSTGLDQGEEVGVDPSGNVVVSGPFNGTVNFGGSNLTSGGGMDIFLAKYDASGVHVWSKSFGAGGTDYPGRMAVDGGGNVAMTGAFSNTVDFGGGGLVSAGGRDIFIARYDASGAYLWSQGFGTPNNDAGKRIAVDAAGNMVVTGNFDNGIVNFGGSNLTSLGGSEIFLVRFKANGTHQWSYRFGGTDSDEGYGVAMGPAQALFLTGYFAGTASFGGSNHSSAGHLDIYLAKYIDEDAIPVLVSSFAATPRARAVDVAWELRSDEALDGFTLYRRHGASSTLAIASGDAQLRGAYTDTSVEPGETYHYELSVRTTAGGEFRSPVASVTMQSVSASLGQNHPNPFNPTTSIEYSLTERAPVVVSIFDATGALVARLDEGMRSAGTHRAQWDGRDASGRVAASGVYFYSLEGVPQAGARKMVLLK